MRISTCKIQVLNYIQIDYHCFGEPVVEICKTYHKCQLDINIQTTAAPATLAQGTTYTIQGTNLLGGNAASTITVDTVTGGHAQKVGTPTDTAVKFKTTATFTGEKIEIKSGTGAGATVLVTTAAMASS